MRGRDRCKGIENVLRWREEDTAIFAPITDITYIFLPSYELRYISGHHMSFLKHISKIMFLLTTVVYNYVYCMYVFVKCFGKWNYIKVMNTNCSLKNPYMGIFNWYFVT